MIKNDITSSISIEQMRKIRDFSVDLDWNLAFGGKSKGNRHLFRAVAWAKRLAQELRERGEKINLEIVEAGTWLHDSGLAVDIQGEALCNANQVSDFLRSVGITEKDISSILECVESHDGRSKAISLEAQVVHDADTLEKLGALGVIRETWKRSQMGWNTEKIAAHLPSHLEKRKNNLYTALAKEKAEELSHKIIPFFQMLREQLEDN